MNKRSNIRMSELLSRELDNVGKNCNECGICVEECKFLKVNGTPLDIVRNYDPSRPKYHILPFECSLCGLCSAVCKKSVRPDALFMAMRNESCSKESVSFREHERVLNYERKGTSKKYSYYSLPENCTTVFFPGCNLPGTRRDKTFRIYELMKKFDDSTGIVLDCCTKPSHDTGNRDYFNAMFGEMKDYLVRSGVKEIVTACPNCYRVFKQYGTPLLPVFLYEYIEKNLLSSFAPSSSSQQVTVHDPCSLRYEKKAHNSIRNILAHMGVKYTEMPHSKDTSFCCGEGGAVSLLKPELAGTWTDKIKSEAGDKMVITSCGGCAGYISRVTASAHILDILFEPEKALKGKVKIPSWPFTYLNRIALKRKLKKFPSVNSREREFSPEPHGRGSGFLKILLFAVIVAAIIIARKAGVTDYLEQEKLRSLITSTGMLAPFIYMAIYVVGTVLFFPGLAISIAGGVLFGPLYGVLYTITGATAGACMAFLVSRYAARGWIESRLKDPRLKALDDSVEKHGWKIVAFTRLIPLFPFNLLNYAFGLTKVRFIDYAIASFVFMLPGCIAFIVFSSSLLDLINGKISKEFIIGLILIAAVSFIPFIWKKLKARKQVN